MNPIIIICLALLLLSGATAAGEQYRKTEPYLPADRYDARYIEQVRKADRHLGLFRFQEAIMDCEAALRYEKNDYLARAIMCLAYYEIAEQLDVQKPDDRKRKTALYEKMEKAAEEGIRSAPGRGECYFMRGLARARLSTTRGLIYSLFMAKSVEQDWLRSLSSESEYSTPSGENLRNASYLALAVFYRLCPSSPMFKLLFGTRGDIDKSVEYGKKACELDPAHIASRKEYGVSLITRGVKNDRPEDVEKGKEMLRMVAALPLRLNTDRIDKVHAVRLLNNPSLCPGYSRDQQQEAPGK